MYDPAWAKIRVKEHLENHTRATEIVRPYFQILIPRLWFFLANALPEWEAWKYLIRMVENSLDIRKNPNTTIHLLSEQALRALDVILLDSPSGNPPYILTGLEPYRTLYEQLRVREPGRQLHQTKTIVPDDGQLDLLQEEP